MENLWSEKIVSLLVSFWEEGSGVFMGRGVGGGEEAEEGRLYY